MVRIHIFFAYNPLLTCDTLPAIYNPDDFYPSLQGTEAIIMSTLHRKAGNEIL
jgi:hypothetical protein